MSEKLKHTQLSHGDFVTAIKNTDTFNGFERFKKGLTLKSQNITRLYDYYQQGIKYGVEYLKQNPYLLSNDVKIISEIINS